MKTAFTFKRWWVWGDEYNQQPQWWNNFTRGKLMNEALKELRSVAKVRVKVNGHIRVVFHGPNELSFFILRYS